jgi:gamma-glutamyl phosphate reductase
MSIELLYNESASTIKEAKKTLESENIDVNSVLDKIYDELTTYAEVVKAENRIDVIASGTPDEKISLYDRVVSTINNYIEPSISLVVFKIVNRGNTISVVRKQ